MGYINRVVLIYVMLLLAQVVGWGQQHIIAPNNRVNSSFAIFADEQTYNNCKEEITLYKNQLEKEGLAVYLLYANWEGPEHIRFFIDKYYKEQALEGAIFIGDIPIPMIRDAHHFTTAFKMDQKRWPMRDASVPSDRYYEDLDLKFNFIKRDSLEKNLYYYSLAADSPQYISCEIYSGRVKPTKEGEEGYEQIRAYLRKVVEEKESDNVLDKVVSYTGHGSFSNSLTAWKDEQITIKEQIPLAFSDSENAKFYIYNMYPNIKEIIEQELVREDVDLMLFHNHGLPDQQCLSALSYPVEDEEAYEATKLYLRRQLRKAKEGNKDVEALKSRLMAEYGVTQDWFKDAFSSEQIEKDSILLASTDIYLEDIKRINPNARLVIFDACYNGDFREKSFVAGEYILGSGKTVVGIGNSVNTLQDKFSSYMLGILPYGAKVGEWMKNNHTLESHIIGDPTFKFKSPDKFPKIKYRLADTSYWVAVMQHNLPSDFKALALAELHKLNYNKMEELLLDVFKNSNSYSLRLQAFTLARYYGAEYFSNILKLGVNDPFEFIRRKSVYYMGLVGKSEFIPYLADLYIVDYTSERVVHNIVYTVGAHFNVEIFLNCLKKRLKEANFYDIEGAYNEIEKKIKSIYNINLYQWENLIDKSKGESNRLTWLSSFRNNPARVAVEDLLSVLKDESESLNIKVAVAEILGWYCYSIRNVDIMNTLEKILSEQPNMQQELKLEIVKSINRLKVYVGRSK